MMTPSEFHRRAMELFDRPAIIDEADRELVEKLGMTRRVLRIEVVNGVDQPGTKHGGPQAVHGRLGAVHQASILSPAHFAGRALRGSPFRSFDHSRRPGRFSQPEPGRHVP